MNKSLTRSIGFWLVPALSLVTAVAGWWLISGQITTMTSALLDGTATGVEVYVGQSLVVVGAALLGTGILGILLTFALTAVQALVQSRRPVVVEPIDWHSGTEIDDALIEDAGPEVSGPEVSGPEVSGPEVSGRELDDPDASDAEAQSGQKGSSGSIATATKISVR